MTTKLLYAGGQLSQFHFNGTGGNKVKFHVIYRNGSELMASKTKPTNYEAAKSVIAIGETVSVSEIIDRLITKGRREIPTSRSLAIKLRRDNSFIITANGRGPTLFTRQL